MGKRTHQDHNQHSDYEGKENSCSLSVRVYHLRNRLLSLEGPQQDTDTNEHLVLVFLNMFCSSFLHDCYVKFRISELEDTINMHVNLHTNSGIFKYAGYVMNY